MADENKAVFQTDSATDESSKFVDTRRSNVKSDLIEITEDKLENILLKHLHCLKYRTGWVAPLSIFATLLVTILTATFTDNFVLKAEEWKPIFIFCCLGAGGWFLLSIIQLLEYWDSTKIETLINKIKAVDK